MLRSDNSAAAIEAVIHPSFSRFFEAPYSNHIPFQDGPEISFNGEVSTFIAVPVKRNDRLLSPNVANHVGVQTGGSFLSLLKTMGRNPMGGPHGSSPTGGLKQTSMRFLNFKRALLPSMLAAVRNMHPEIRSATSEHDLDAIADLGTPVAAATASSPCPQSRKVSEQKSRANWDMLQTNPAAQSASLLMDGRMAENVSEHAAAAADNIATEAEREEERVRGQLLRATGLLLPTETQWYLLNELRIHAGAPERSENGIERLSHYYAQLLHLEPKFPFETDEIQMNFLWYEGFFPDRKVVTNCIQYEKAAVLFNIAAVYTALALSQSLWTPDGKRKAAACFQKGAGILFHIRDRLCARFKPKLEKGSDLSEPTLSAAAEIMLAQAMECFYEKATDTKASSAVTAKIAAQTSDFYEVASRAAQAPTKIGHARFPDLWVNHIKAKTLLFGAIAHMHTAPASAAEAAVGERIARVSVARDMVDKALKCSKENGGPLHELVQGHAKIISTAHTFLVHANFERHHHPTYDDRLLPPLRRPLESLVSAIPLEQSITDPRSFTDIFYAIMSPTNHVGVKQILDDCSAKIEAGRGELMNCIVDIDCQLATLGLAVVGTESLSAAPGDHATKEEGASPDTTGLSSYELQARANLFLEELRLCTSDEDAFSGGDMIDCFEKLVQIAESNMKESLDILNQQPTNSATHVATVRTVAIACNTRTMECSARLADLKRKWDCGIGDVAAYTEDDIKNILPFGTTGLLQPDTDSSSSTPQLDAARKERDMVLRKLDWLRRTCNEHVADIERLHANDKDPGGALGSTAVSIDVHSAIQSRHEQLRVIEEALKTVRREKNGLLTKIEHLSSLIRAVSHDRMDAIQTRQVVEKLLAAISRYREWRSKVEDEIQRGMRVREDSCRLLVRCLLLPRDGGSGDGDATNVEPLPAKHGEPRDPLFSQFMHEAKSALAGGDDSFVGISAGASTVPPFNPSVSSSATLTRLVELRSALSASGIHPRSSTDPTRPKSTQPHNAERAVNLETQRLTKEWKNLFETQRDTLAQLLMEKADSDLALSRLHEQMQNQQMTGFQGSGQKPRVSTGAAAKNEAPAGPAPYHPLNQMQRGKPQYGLRRKPAHPAGTGLTSGTEKLRQILRFVGMRRGESSANNVHAKNLAVPARSGTQPDDAQSRKTSYATAPAGDRNFSTASRALGYTERAAHQQNPPIIVKSAANPSNAGVAAQRSAQSSQQPSIVEHADEQRQQEQLLAELSLADYDEFCDAANAAIKADGLNESPEGDMVEMLPVAMPDTNLPSRLDDIYTQIRALMLSQDALRTQKANDMREALATILKSCDMRLGGVEDSMGRWTQRKMDDARERLTDALERLDREERRKGGVERDAELDARRARGTDRAREDMYRAEKARRERMDRTDERQRTELRDSERKLRELVEQGEREAEKLRKASFSLDDRKGKGKERIGEREGGGSRQTRSGQADETRANQHAHQQRQQPPQELAAGGERIARWVEDQRRMSQSSLGQVSDGDAGKGFKTNTSQNRPGDSSRAHTRANNADASYERIASAAAAAAAAGVSAAFRFEQHGGEDSPRYLYEHAGPRRDVPAVTFSVPGQRVTGQQAARHTIRRKPSGGPPVHYYSSDGDFGRQPAQQSQHPLHRQQYANGYDGNRYYEDQDQGAAAAAEPLRRGSAAGAGSRGNEHYELVSESDRLKEHNDSLVREFIVGEPAVDPVGARVERFERERRGQRRG
ncbi:Rhophilin, Rho GTPase binding protein [Geranomyces variabilis]|uniref:Rhophilin, Rho GTPase binding protein n=1 Tax=Geranomyces variabilis TaxID=109894 RepID=A0AAD5XPB6_9FUNG|nr:Rhophilin, Rho GTPase binding protein [Geranomyces variabilis]